MAYFSGVISEDKSVVTATTTNFTAVPIPENGVAVVQAFLKATRVGGTIDSVSLQLTHDGSNWATAATDTTGWSASFNLLLQYRLPVGVSVRLVVVTSGAGNNWGLTGQIALGDPV